MAEVAAQEDCCPCTIWRDLSAIEPARLASLLQSDQVRYSPRQLEGQAKTSKPQLARDAMTMEVGGLCGIMSYVLGFGRHAEVLEPTHLRQAVAQEIAATAEIYGEKRESVYKGDSQRGTS